MHDMKWIDLIFYSYVAHMDNFFNKMPCKASQSYSTMKVEAKNIK